MDDHSLAGHQPSGGAQQVPGGQTLGEQGERVGGRDVLRDVHEGALGGQDLLGVAVGDAGDDASAVRCAPRDLAARHVGQHVGGQVRAVGLVGVREVDACGLDRDQGLSGLRFRGGQFHGLKDLGAAEAVEPDGDHATSIASLRPVAQPLLGLQALVTCAAFVRPLNGPVHAGGGRAPHRAASEHGHPGSGSAGRVAAQVRYAESGSAAG